MAALTPIHIIAMNEAAATITPAPQEIKLTERHVRNFWRHINKDGPTMPHMESPCWIWTAFKTERGYGRVGVGPKVMAAHRISWIIAHGQIPLMMCVCHRCDNPSCCNPSHFFLGTQADNVRDREIKKRGNRAYGDNHGSRIHPESRPRGEAHGSAKLTAAQVLEIRALYAAGDITLKQLATQFNVSNVHIRFIVIRKLWKHLS